MNKREISKRLAVCKEDHGGEYNARRATVYGHASRTCIRIVGTDVWVYSPGVSVFEEIQEEPVSQPSIDIALWGKTVTLVPEIGWYDNKRPAVQLFDPTDPDGIPFCTVTVNMPHDHLNAGEVFIKDWAENDEIVFALVREGWLVDTGREIASGFVNPKVMRPAGPLADYIEECMA